jgi:hypothetical protein
MSGFPVPQKAERQAERSCMPFRGTTERNGTTENRPETRANPSVPVERQSGTKPVFRRRSVPPPPLGWWKRNGGTGGTTDTEGAGQ